MEDENLFHLEIAKLLDPVIKNGQLRLFKIPREFKTFYYPRVIIDPGKLISVAFFCDTLKETNPLTNLLGTQLWKTEAYSDHLLSDMKSLWEPLPLDIFEMPINVELYTYKANQQRDILRDFAFLSKQKFTSLLIRDPFIFRSEGNANLSLELLKELSSKFCDFPRTLFVYARYDNSSQSTQEAAAIDFVKSAKTAALMHHMSLDAQVLDRISMIDGSAL